MDNGQNKPGYEEVILVDKEDRELGVMEKLEAHRQAHLHRAFSVFLINDKNEMLLQQRAYTKYHSPGLWSNTCCSHPKPGEPTDVAAARRLQEEMGIKSPLKKAYSFIYKTELHEGIYEHEYDHVYIGNFSGTPNINTVEVADWKYMHIQDIGKDIKLNPHQYTYWFQVVFDKITELQENQEY